MKADLAPISIVGCRTTDQGILLKFSDGKHYLFHTEFLIEIRDRRADHIPMGEWLSQRWRRSAD